MAVQHCVALIIIQFWVVSAFYSSSLGRAAISGRHIVPVQGISRRTLTRASTVESIGSSVESIGTVPTGLDGIKLSYTEMLANEPTEMIDVDYVNLEPDDLHFATMPIPDSNGPLGDAYARHIQWRQQLSEYDLKRWIDWANQARLDEHRYQYNLQDYIFQSIQREIHDNAAIAHKNNASAQAQEFTLMGAENEQEQIDDVLETMRVYYATFNSQNYDNLRAMWLQDGNIELVLPGYGKARGGYQVDRLYQLVLEPFVELDGSNNMGQVIANVTAVHTHGNIALVHTVEEVNMRINTKSPFRPKIDPFMVKPRVFATTILRRLGPVWLIVCHHAVRMDSSPLTSDHMIMRFTKEDARLRAVRIAETMGISVPPQAHQTVRSSSAALEASPTSGFTAQAEAPMERDPLAAVTSNDLAALLHVEPDDPLRNASRKAGVIEGELVDDAAVRRRKADKLGIDGSASWSKQTVQALRLLEKQSKITKEEKDALIGDLVSSLAENRPSRAQVAYEMMCGSAAALEETTDMTAHLSDFSDQCRLILDSLERDDKKKG